MELTLDVIKGLRLYQPRRGYRFSLDALLLEDFVRPPRAERIADLGAGVGIVGLLLARRYRRARVLLVELQPPLAELARKNVALSGLSRRVQVLQADVREPKGLGEAGGFDLVVSNPPYRRPGAGRLSPTEQRAVARHELALSLQELLRAAAYLLRNKGRFFLVHHPERLVELLLGLRAHGLEPKRLRAVHGRAHLRAKVLLLEAVKGAEPGLLWEPPLVVYGPDGAYTQEARDICQL